MSLEFCRLCCYAAASFETIGFEERNIRVGLLSTFSDVSCSNLILLTHGPFPRDIIHWEGCSEIIITERKQTREYFDEILRNTVELVHIFLLSLTISAGYIAHFSALIG